MISLAATILTWANACFIVLLTLMAYHDAIEKRFPEVKRHLRIAGVLALVTAMLWTVVLYENRLLAKEQLQEMRNSQLQNSSWNAAK